MFTWKVGLKPGEWEQFWPVTRVRQGHSKLGSLGGRMPVVY